MPIPQSRTSAPAAAPAPAAPPAAPAAVAVPRLLENSFDDPLFPLEVVSDARAYLDMCASDVDSTSLILCVYGNHSQREAFRNLKTHLHPKDRLYVLGSPGQMGTVRDLVGAGSAVAHHDYPAVPYMQFVMLPKQESLKAKRAWDVENHEAISNQWARDTGFLQTKSGVCSVMKGNLWNIDNCFPTPAWADSDFRGGNLVTGTTTAGNGTVVCC